MGNKKYLSILKAFMVFIIIVTLGGLFPVVGEIKAESSILICIDPGHGGKDPGAVGPTGLTEKEEEMDNTR
jgi:N-acetylmuramoyl-L-alanine amidase